MGYQNIKSCIKMGGKKTRQVIIGNSAAGLSAIRSIRRTGCLSSITLISQEDCNAYSPVLLTYYISGKISKNNLFIVGSDFYRENNVRVIFGKKAVSIDTLEQRVYLEDDTWVEYDNLLCM